MDANVFINQHKNKLFNLAAIVLALIVSNNIYKAQQKEASQITERKNTEIKKNSELEQISRLERNISSYRNLLAKREPNEVMNTLNTIAKNSGIKIVSIKPGNEQKSTDYVRFPFNLVISVNDYHSIGEFISKVESYKDFFIVDGLEIRSDSNTKGLSVTLTISTISFIN